MRLIIVCEDDAVGQALAEFFSPFCSEFVIRVKGTNGYGNFKKVVATEVELVADEADTYVLGLVDLYRVEQMDALPSRINKADNPLQAKFDYVQSYFRPRPASPNAEVFPVVVELETWFIADYEGLNRYLRDEVAKRIPTPEAKEQPTAILKGYFRQAGRIYDKGSDSPKLLHVCSAQRVYDDHCPHFRLLIEHLLRWQGKLATQAEIRQPDLFYERWAEAQNLLDALPLTSEADMTRVLIFTERLEALALNRDKAALEALISELEATAPH